MWYPHAIFIFFECKLSFIALFLCYVKYKKL